MTRMAHSHTETTLPAPPVVDRETWQRERDALLVREKAHTREGDAIAAARRRLPMTEVGLPVLTGDDGQVSLLDVFGDREQLIVYKNMWHLGQPFEGQCEGCTLNLWNFQRAEDAAYLNEKGVGFAVFCDGPWEEVRPFRDFMGYTQPWYSTHGSTDLVWETEGVFTCLVRRGDSVYLTYETTNRGVESMIPSFKLLDLTAVGRQEWWEDSPEGWPQDPSYQFWRRDGRPTAQWTRPGVGAVPASAEHHHH